MIVMRGPYGGRPSFRDLVFEEGGRAPPADKLGVIRHCARQGRSNPARSWCWIASSTNTVSNRVFRRLVSDRRLLRVRMLRHIGERVAVVGQERIAITVAAAPGRHRLALIHGVEAAAPHAGGDVLAAILAGRRRCGDRDKRHREQGRGGRGGHFQKLFHVSLRSLCCCSVLMSALRTTWHSGEPGAIGRKKKQRNSLLNPATDRNARTKSQLKDNHHSITWRYPARAIMDRCARREPRRAVPLKQGRYARQSNKLDVIHYCAGQPAVLQERLLAIASRAFQTLTRLHRTARDRHRLISQQMEGSMKMMSWSRYHCLSRSIPRAAHLRPAARRHKIRRQHRGFNRAAARGAPLDVSGSFLRNCFESVMRMFRTWMRPGDTDT